jgi:uncharacterized protein (DUF2062 family)
VPIRRAWEKIKVEFVHILHLDDSAHRIALGMAVGAFVAVTPTWGIQMLLVVGVAWLVRANKVAGIPMVWLTNPFTNVPIYSFCYIVGQAIAGGPGLEEVKHAFAPDVDPGLSLWARSVATAQQWGELMLRAALPLWVGCVIVGLVAGVACYVGMYYILTWHRRRHPRNPAGNVAADAPAGAAPGDPADRVKP